MFFSRLILISLCVIGSFRSRAQESRFSGLRVGDKVPNLVFSQILNFNQKKAELSDFKGKLVILDFWNTNCSVCIREFPKLWRLQQKYKDRLLILPVGIESIKIGAVNDFIKKRKGTSFEMKLPTAVETIKIDARSNLLYRLFPWQSFPQTVWIDGDGYLRGISDHRAVTESNIDSLLNGRVKNLFESKPLYIIDPCKQIFLIGNKAGHRYYGSSVSRYIDTLAFRPRLRDNISCDSSVWHIVNVNQPVVYSYSLAYRDIFTPLTNDSYYKRIIIESKNKDEFYKDWSSTIDVDNWEYNKVVNENFFCYEAILPRSYSKEEAFSFVIQDFDRYFKIRSTIENRIVQCLALQKFDEHLKFKSDSGSIVIRKSLAEDSILVRSFPMNNFLIMLNNNIRSKVIINETGYSGNLDIELLGVKDDDIPSYNAALHQYGLRLIEVERELPMLILKDMKTK